MNSIRWFCLVLWLGIATHPGFAQEPPATGPLVKGDGLLVHIEGPHRGLGTATHQQQRNEHWLHAHSSVNAEPARSSSGLNR